MFTAVDEGPIIRRRLQGFCLTADIQSGAQQTALLDFFTNVVLPELCSTCGYTAIYLTDVDNDFENLTAVAGPYTIIADIELKAN